MHALLDGIGEVDCAKGRWRGEDGDASGRQCVDRLPIGIEADEGAVIRNIHPLRKLLGQRSLHGADPFRRHVGHRHELDPTSAGVEGVEDRAATATAAADERCLNLVTARDMRSARRQTVGPQNARRDECQARGAEKLAATAGHERTVVGAHDWLLRA